MERKLPTTNLQRRITSVIITFMFGTLPFLVNAQTAPTNLIYAQDSGLAWHTYPQNSVAPTINNGGATVTYSLVSPPAGVTINPTTGQISWDATAGAGSYSLTVTATNSVGSTTGTYFLHVIPNPNDFFTVKYTAAAATTVQYGASTTYNNVDVYKPTSDTHTLRPVLMFLHGGGFQSSGTKTESYVVSFCKYFATLGFVCFAPNYNEGSGHTAAQNLAALKDADSCLKWIRNPVTVATYKYDPQFLYFGGGSAGAHLSCNFAFCDTTHWYNGYKTNLKNVIAFADCWGSSPVMNSSGSSGDRLYSFSSLNKNSLPAYMVQGSADQTVPVQNGIDLNNALTAVGAYHDWWEISGETHGCPNHIPQISDSMKTFFLAMWKLKYPQTSNPVVTPVQLSSFGASLSDNKVLIKWVTATELNVNHYEIERSLNGETFNTIGSLETKGNSAVDQSYLYADDASVLAGIVYYRLKSIDNDGKTAYSSIASINIKASKNIVTTIYPNPLYNEQNLTVNYISTKSDKITFQVVNALGQKVITNSAFVNEGNNALPIRIAGLKPGLYYLTVLNNNAVVQRLSFIIH